MNIKIWILAFIFCQTSLFGQGELKPVKDGVESFLGSFSSSNGQIKSATIASETGVTLDLSLDLEGFNRDKKYKIKGEILSKLKLKIKEIDPVTIEVVKSSNAAEMTFKFNASSSTAYTSNKIESGFLRLTATEVDPRLGDLLGDSGLNSTSFLFECKKEWRIKGNLGKSNIMVQVVLVPFKSAANISQYAD